VSFRFLPRRSEKCFARLNWPWDLTADFFYQGRTTSTKPKTNFVEVRTFLHIFRSFNRMWMFFILAFQAMLIVSWSSSGSLSALADATVFRSVLSVFITAALLNFIKGVVLSSKCFSFCQVELFCCTT
jgi:callose synthase